MLAIASETPAILRYGEATPGLIRRILTSTHSSGWPQTAKNLTVNEQMAIRKNSRDYEDVRTRETQEDSGSPLYGLFSYKNTLNLGDEIQSIAASTFLPRIDYFINRDTISLYDRQNIKLIMNGWYGHAPEFWPPPDAISPLLVSMHISEEITKQNKTKTLPSSIILSERNQEYLRQHGPIGARDLNTMRMFNDSGVDSYFSGCITLTLPFYLGERTDEVCCVDINDQLFIYLKSLSKYKLSQYSHVEYDNSRLKRFALATDLLDRYKRARLVVTSRLHCALPCLAFGTPVVFVESAPDHYRFDGLRELLHVAPLSNLESVAQLAHVAELYGNKTDFSPLRRELQATASRFVHGK